MLPAMDPSAKASFELQSGTNNYVTLSNVVVSYVSC